MIYYFKNRLLCEIFLGNTFEQLCLDYATPYVEISL